MVLGVDFGDSRTGYAISDSLELMAHTLEVFHEKNFNKVAEHTATIVAEKNIDTIVLGFPKNMNGTIGDRGKKSQRMAKTLKKLTGKPVILWDERLTTVSAHNLMNETNVRGQKRKDTVDQVAAAFILQSYLDNKR